MGAAFYLYSSSHPRKISAQLRCGVDLYRVAFDHLWRWWLCARDLRVAICPSCFDYFTRDQSVAIETKMFLAFIRAVLRKGTNVRSDGATGLLGRQGGVAECGHYRPSFISRSNLAIGL